MSYLYPRHIGEQGSLSSTAVLWGRKSRDFMIKNLKIFFFFEVGQRLAELAWFPSFPQARLWYNPSRLDWGTRASQGQVLLGRKESSAVLQNSSFSSPEHEILLFTCEHQVEILEIILTKLQRPPMIGSTCFLFFFFFNSYLSTSCLQHFVSYSSDGSALIHSEPALPVSRNSVRLPVSLQFGGQQVALGPHYPIASKKGCWGFCSSGF